VAFSIREGRKKNFTKTPYKEKRYILNKRTPMDSGYHCRELATPANIWMLRS
jgi:hypothetical protein